MPSFYIAGNERAQGAVFAAAAGTLLLDTLSATSILALSSRKLRSAYSGSALKVTTSAGGNATQDIGFAGTDLDTAALATFIGSNGGSINTWYDQSGNTTNLFNGTVVSQPVICNSGINVVQNGHVWALGTVANGSFIAVITNITQPFTIAALFKFDNITTGSDVLTDGSLYGVLDIVSGNRYALFAGVNGIVTGPPNPDTSVHCGVAVFNGASSQIIIDGVATTVSPGAGGIANFSIWNAQGDGHVGEILVFSGLLSAGDQSLIRSSWQTYWGAP